MTMTMASTAGRLLVVGACALGSMSCSSTSAPEATTPERSAATTSARPAANEEVSDRARAALTRVGAQRVVVDPGYGDQVNTAVTGAWRGSPFTTYVVPTSALAAGSDLSVVGRRHIEGRTVDVVRGEDSTVRMLRFVLGPDTWLLDFRGDRTVGVALVAALLA